MRELEFLPRWYPQLRRRRRIVVVQAWLTVALAFGILTWGLTTRAHVHRRQAERQDLGQKITRTNDQLKELDELLEMKKQLKTQEQIIARIGLNVETSRLIARLDRLLPKEMSMLSLSMETIEQARRIDSAASMAEVRQQPIDRLLKVRLTGVAPSDVDVSNLVTNLNSVPFFQQVTPVQSHDRADRGHLEREFEVTFCMSLNSLAEE